jgi:hypothetical protein
MIMPLKTAHLRACGLAVRVMELSALAVAAPALAMPTPVQAPPEVVPLSDGKPFRLDESQSAQAPQPRLFIGTLVDRGEAAPVKMTPADEKAGNLLDRLLTIREDLHFLINHTIQGLSNERITVGLNFARAF